MIWDMGVPQMEEGAGTDTDQGFCPGLNDSMWNMCSDTVTKAHVCHVSTCEQAAFTYVHVLCLGIEIIKAGLATCSLGDH